MEQIKYLIGDSLVEKESFEQLNTGMLSPFSDVVCEFLEVLSKKIMESDEAKQYQDVVSLGFWCRKSNITKMKARYLQSGVRIGRGMAFHIAPSNVPINTYYTLFLGLLSGCRNIVRTSSKDFPQIDLVAQYINDVLEDCFYEIKKYIYIIRYPRDSHWTSYFSDKCLVRVIWGGDETIRHIANNSVHPRCKEIKFADRYSFAVMETGKISDLNQGQLKRIAHAFYNDTYLNDQNACSSPHLFFWLKNDHADEISDVKKRFWNAVYEESLKYDLPEIKSTEKYTLLCNEVMKHSYVSAMEKYDNRVYVCELSEIPENAELIRGKYGMFYEYESMDLNEILVKLTAKTQTCLYYGDIKDRIMEAVLKNGLACIDRVVPLGKSLDISEVWDGYNLIDEMTRIIMSE